MSRSMAMQCYVPEFLRSSRIFATVLSVEEAEMDDLITSQQEVIKQFFVETAADWGLDRWEEMLGLPSYAAKPIDQRRSRIISKLRGMGAVTVALIKNVTESYTNGTVDITEHPETYSFTITFADQHGIPPNYEDLQAVIEEIKPAHLAVNYVLRYLIWNELDAATITWNQLDAKNLTWDEFELGGWLNA